MSHQRMTSRERAQEEKQRWLREYRASRERGKPDRSYLMLALNAHLDTLDHRSLRVHTAGRSQVR